MPGKVQLVSDGRVQVDSSFSTAGRLRKTGRSSIAQQSSQGDRAVGLEELPHTAAAIVYQCLDARSRTSLAAVSRWARDLVLREVRSVELQVHSTAAHKPLVGLLNRVCSAARAGRLSLSLEAHGFAIDSPSNVLSELLAPATQQGGWASVKELALKALPGSSTPVLKLVSAAFPALQSVTICKILFTRADLGSLSACSQLVSLQLLFCLLQYSEAGGIASPLSALHSLRHLAVHNTTSSLVAGLTQLTGLSLGCGYEVVTRCVDHITGLTQLQHLELSSAQHVISAEVLLSILTSLKQPTSLVLNYIIQQAAFDALLTHAPQLTSFTCSELYLEEDRSASPCSWKELVMNYQGLDTQTLARIPTGSLARLAFENVVFPSPSPTLKFVPHGYSPANMPEFVHRSLVNLMRCPAWQQCGPEINVILPRSLRDVDMPELLSLVPALAPLASKEVKLSIHMPAVALGASEVRQLGVTLGNGLKQLVLMECKVLYDFWPAVWAHLPGLQQLTILSNVRGAIGVDELASFCSRATRPLQLSLGWHLYRRVEGKLDQGHRWMGVPQVTVTKAVRKGAPVSHSVPSTSMANAIPV